MTTPQTDYYAILGVKVTATPDEIRHAYRTLAKEWHPDRFREKPLGTQHNAEQRMRQLTEAHSVLGDPEKRAVYDRQHRAGVAGHGYAMHMTAEGVPFYGSRSTYAPGVPGFAPPRDLPLTTHGENGVAFIFALIALIIAVTSFFHITRGSIDNSSYIFLALIAIFSPIAFVCFANPSGVTRWLQQATLREMSHGHAHATQTLTPFEELVQEILWSLPAEFADSLDNMMVVVESEPSHEVLQRAGVHANATLLGLYQGVPTTSQHVGARTMPEIITLFQGPIERHGQHSPSRIANQIRATLLHELAHHFGMSHEEMPIWVKE